MNATAGYQGRTQKSTEEMCLVYHRKVILYHTLEVYHIRAFFLLASLDKKKDQSSTEFRVRGSMPFMKVAFVCVFSSCRHDDALARLTSNGLSVAFLLRIF